MTKTKPQSKAKARVTAKSSRQLKTPRYHFWRRHRVPKPQLEALPNGWHILRQTRRLLWQHKRLLLKILLIYAVLNLILVRGFSATADVQSIKTSLADAFKGTGGQVASGVAIFGYLVSLTGNTTSAGASAYQTVLLIVVSLALIWMLRQVTAGHKATMRDAYYRGMYPLVPFTVVVFIMALQLIPFVIGTSLYSIVTSNNIASGWFELSLWGGLALILVAWSVYLLLPSLVALYVVTLPDMTPRKAIRSAKQLVNFRRWNILRKLLLLLLVLLVVSAAILVPTIIFWAPIAAWVFFVLTIVLLAIAHAYLYTLYRELINHAGPK